MAATTKQAAGAGFRHLRVYELDGNGLPENPTWGAAADAYDGLQATVAKALTITIPDPQILSHTGDDRVAAVDMLPPTEAMTAEARTGHTNLEIDAIFSNTNVVTDGEMQIMGRATDRQGLEPDVMLMGYRQAVRTGSVNKGARCWIFAMMPKALVFPKAGPSEEQGMDENTYTVQPRIVTAWPWQIAFALVTEGYTETQLLHGISDKRPHMAIWLGDAVEVAFDFTAGYIPEDIVDKISVYQWVASTGITTDVTGTVTTTLTEITFGAAPAAGDKVLAFYEITD